MKKLGIISIILGIVWFVPWISSIYFHVSHLKSGGLPMLPKLSNAFLLFFFGIFIPIAICIAAIILSIKSIRQEKSKLAIIGLIFAVIGLIFIVNTDLRSVNDFSEVLGLKLGIIDEYELSHICGTPDMCEAFGGCNPRCKGICEENAKNGYPEKMISFKENLKDGLLICSCTCGK